MIGNLLKYDIKWRNKVLNVFYIITIVFAILTRIFFSIENSFIFDIIAKICSGTTISLMINILINNILRSWARFVKNIYGDESYLTHTLPVDRKTVYTSSFLASLITMFTSICVIVLSMFIAYYSKENMQIFKSILEPIVQLYDTSILSFVLVVIFVLFLEIFVMLQIGYSGIIVGHKKNNAKMGFSILYGFIFYGLTQMGILAVLFVIGLFNKDVMNMFFTNEVVSIDLIKNIMYLAIGLYSACTIIWYFINRKMFSKGINVD